MAIRRTTSYWQVTIASSQGFNLDIGSSEGYGIDITNNASNNQIGGPNTADSNTISGNVGPGVYVASGTADAIQGNSIYHNAGLGIDLAPEGPNPNQPPLTQSSGPNNLQNYPVLNVATINPDNVSEAA